MVTVIVGKSHDGKRTRILSLSDVVGATNEFEFEAGSRADIKPGEPKWANYIKGCIANFICKSSAILNVTHNLFRSLKLTKSLRNVYFKKVKFKSCA